MVQSILLSVGAGILLLVGFLGTFVPVLPGAPLAWGGLLLAYFSPTNTISVKTLIICGIAAVAVSVIDNIFPVLMTKKSGGSKAGTIGATLGLIAGFFLGPVGIIAGPFVGALVGELIHDFADTGRALKAAFGSFLGFLCGTGLKMATVGMFIFIFVKSF